MKSIFPQEPGQCFLCNHLGVYIYHSTTQEHHVFYGTANRKISEKHGLKVNLCLAHHEGNQSGNKQAVHHNQEMNDLLKKIVQKEFERLHSRAEFRKEFGRSWL